MMTRRRFEELSQQVLEGTCPPTDLRELEDELTRSARRRHDYREAFLLHEILRLEAANGADRGAAPRTLAFPRWRVLGGVTAAAAAVALAVLALRRPAPAPVNITAAPHSTYTVRDGNAEPVRDFRPGSTVDLEEGTLELNLPGGVRALLQAPARVTLVEPLRLWMDHGAGRFVVPRQARGFTVETPSVEAVDLGTEFGLVDRPEKSPQLHVFKGRVKFTSTHGLRDSTVVEAGETVRSTVPGRLESSSLNPQMFYSELPPDLPFVHLGFDEETDGVLVVDGCHPAVPTLTARLHRDSPGLVPSPRGMAARFNGGPTPILTDWDGIEGAAPRTISAWIRAEKNEPFRSYQTIAGWGDPTMGLAGKCELLLFQPEPGKPTVLRLSFDQYYFSGTTDLADGRWHHVAATGRFAADGSPDPVVRLYVDGRPEPLDRERSITTLDRIRGPRTVTRDDTSMPLVIGFTDRPQAGRGFRGEIDEVMIHEAALDEKRIRRLAAGNPEGF